MRKAKTLLLLVPVLSLQANAYNWTDVAPFHCPANIAHHCGVTQQRGYRFEDVNDGTFIMYGDNRFSGFVMSSDLVNATSRSDAVAAQHHVVGALHNSPSMYTTPGQTFSVKHLRSRATCEVPIELVYQMSDGSRCTSSHLGTLGWSDISNTQCGGASKLTFRAEGEIPPACSIEISAIEFYCDSPGRELGRRETAGTATSSDEEMQFPAWSYALTHDIAWSHMPSQGSAGVCSNQACWDTAISRNTGGTSSTGSTVSVPEKLTATVTSSAMCVERWCSYLPMDSTQNVSRVDSTGCKDGWCMARPTLSGAASRGESTAGPPRTTILSHTTTEATAVVQSTNEAACPVLLPRCLNTWLFVSPCHNNTDSDCFCRSEDFVTGALGCINAWSQSVSDRTAATLCLQGICAKYISKNPAIIIASAGRDDSPSITPGFTCPHNQGSLGRSQQLCTTVTYLPAVADSAGRSLAALGLTAHSGAGRMTASATTVTLPLIYLGTSTVTSSRTVPTRITATVDGSSAVSLMHSFGPFTYRPDNASRTLLNASSASRGGSMPTGSDSVQTVSPFAGGAAVRLAHPIGFTFAAFALAAAF